MTKYLLNSGGISNSADKGKSFFNSIVEGLGKHPKILFCFFASPREDWEHKYQSYKAGFTRQLNESIEPQFKLAMPDKFADQLLSNDAVYIHGGDDYLLQYWLKQYDLPLLFKDKVVATNSASSNALSKSFWTCDWRVCMDGLGILPIKFLPHYLSEFGVNDPRGPIDWAVAMTELKSYGDTGLPIHALKEGEYIKIDQ